MTERHERSTGWRWPTAREVRVDFGYLSSFLSDQVATPIAEMPVAIIDATPLSTRVDAWLWRSSRWLAGGRP